MEINWDIVDQFEREHGDQIAIATAREFYFAYFSLVRAALPPMARQAFEIAQKCKQGTATSEECKAVHIDTWKYVSEHKAWGDTSPEYSLMRALLFLVPHPAGRGENEPLTELIDWFLYYVNQFEDHSDSAAALIEQFFNASS